MKLLRVPLERLEPGARTLDEKTTRYVTRVHRLDVGERFLAFDPVARVEGEVEILQVGKRAQCRVGPLSASTAPPSDSVVLLQCLGKGDKPERVIAAATALSVARVTFVESARSIVDLGERSASRLARYRTVAVEAARQCGRGDVPTITGPLPFEEALAVEPGCLSLCLAPEGSTSLADALLARNGRPLTLLVGPEGGFTEEELELCRARGFSFVRLGVHVLRTELAATAALGAVAAFSREKNANLKER